MLMAREIGASGRLGRLALEDGQDRAVERAAGQRGDLAGDADHGLQVPEGALDVELEHGVAQVVDQRRADRCIIGQDQVALVFVAQVQFLLGTDHPLGHDPADLAWFQPHDLPPSLWPSTSRAPASANATFGPVPAPDPARHTGTGWARR